MIEKEIVLIERVEAHIDTRRERKKLMLSTPISPQILRRVQNADTGQRSVFSFNPNII